MSYGFLALIVLLTPPTFALSNVDRWRDSPSPERQSLIFRGLAAELNTHAEEAQFHLLLCQPRAAWAWAQKIVDPALRARFEAVILALASTPTPGVDRAVRARRRGHQLCARPARSLGG